MENVSRDGHRSRLRKQYFDSGVEDMSVRNLIELYISLTVPRKDVKHLVYALMNKFHTVEGIFSASYDELMSISGIQSNTAMSILTLTQIINRAEKNKNSLNRPMKRLIYARSLFENQPDCDLLAVSFMTASMNIKNTVILENFVPGDRNFISKIIQHAIQNRASALFLSHYMPRDKAVLHGNDIDFLCDTKIALRDLNIEIIDYIIISKSNDIVMSQNEKLRQLFV